MTEEQKAAIKKIEKRMKRARAVLARINAEYAEALKSTLDIKINDVVQRNGVEYRIESIAVSWWEDRNRVYATYTGRRRTKGGWHSLVTDLGIGDGLTLVSKAVDDTQGAYGVSSI